MSLFSRGSGSCYGDCGHHHWGDPRTGCEYKIEVVGPDAYWVKAKGKFKCQHDGCNQRKTGWVQLASVETLDAACDRIRMEL